MMPAQIIVEIAEEGGEIRLDSGRLKVKGVPARLIPIIREHKAALLALLSAPALDDYATAEREAIQEESAEVSDLPDKPVLSLQEQAEAVLDHYGADWQRGVDDLRIVAKNHVLAALVEKMGLMPPNPPAWILGKICPFLSVSLVGNVPDSSRAPRRWG